MIINRIQKVNESIETYVFAQENKNRIDGIERINKSLDILYKNMIKISNFVNDVVPTINIKIKINQKLVSLIENIENGIQGNISIELLNAYIKQIETEISNIDISCSEGWKNYYLKNFKDLIGTLSLLRRVMNDMEIARASYGISKYEKKWPITKNDIDDLNIAKKSAHDKIISLKIDKEIEQFLIKTTTGQANVSDLTNNILSWLRITGAQDYISLKTTID